MKRLETTIIYQNPMPQLCSRQAMFPCLCKCSDKKIAAVFAIGEAFESVDLTSYISFSEDDGKSWTEPVQMFDKNQFDRPFSDCCKAVKLPDGSLMAMGYAFWRDNKDLPMGNAQTGGLLDDFVFYSISQDDGKSWTKPQEIKCYWGGHVEASAPITVLKDGTLITPITGFPDWQGKMHGEQCGRALCSNDGGQTWQDLSVCMQFDKNITCYEQRLCQLESGVIVNIGWNENVDTGERLANHFTYSLDNGKTWTYPQSTGVFGQASSLCALGGEKLLAIHSIRRDTQRPGIYGYIVDFSNKKWDIISKEILWEPNTPVVKDNKMAEIFAYLKFGQPSAIKLNDDTLLMTHWYCEQGEYKIALTTIKI